MDVGMRDIFERRSSKHDLALELLELLEMEGCEELRSAWKQNKDPKSIIVKPLEQLPSFVRNVADNSRYIQTIVKYRDNMVELSIGGIREMVTRDFSQRVVSLANSMISSKAA